MKKFILPVLLSFILMMCSCSNTATSSSSPSSSSQTASVTTPAPSPSPSPLPYEGKPVSDISPSGRYILYHEKHRPSEGYSDHDVMLYDSEDNEIIYLCRSIYSTYDRKFLSENEIGIFNSYDYRVFDCDGNLIFKLSDTISLAEYDREGNTLLGYWPVDDGRIIFLYFDETESLSLNRPLEYYELPMTYKLAILNADRTAVQTIDTGKLVETYKSLYCGCNMRFEDENTITLYLENWSYTTKSDICLYETTVNLATGRCTTTDYRK